MVTYGIHLRYQNLQRKHFSSHIIIIIIIIIPLRCKSIVLFAAFAYISYASCRDTAAVYDTIR